MAAFEHVTALLSFVYALALTHLLARLAELVIARERVSFSGLLTLAMINALTVVFANWLSIWDLRTKLGPRFDHDQFSFGHIALSSVCFCRPQATRGT